MTTEIVGLVILFLGLAGVSFFLGEWIAMTCWIIRERLRKNLNLKVYQKWGFGQEVYVWPFSDGKVGVRSGFLLVFVTIIALASVVLLICGVKSIGVATNVADHITTIICIILFLILCLATSGFINRIIQLDSLKEKLSKLESLRGGRFLSWRANRAVALSMYETLRIAPTIFWDAYVELHNANPNARINQEFRELVAPYSRSRPNQYEKLRVLISLVTLVIGVAYRIIPLIRPTQMMD